MSNWKFIDSGSTFDLEDDLYFKVQQAPGTGMPPVSNIRSDYGILDGALFQRTRTETRQFSLIGTLKGDTIADLHSRRRALIDRIKSDRSASQLPTIVRYDGSGSQLTASGFYTGGLEFGDVEVNTEAEIALGFEMLNPYWENTSDDSASLSVKDELSDVNYVIQRSACGEWSNMASGYGGQPYAFIEASGQLHVFGTLVGASENAAVVWDGEAWTTFSKVNSHIYTAVKAGNTIYVGGYFTQASGVTACRVAQYNGQGWSTMGSGMNDYVRRMVLGSDGTVYATGPFNSADGSEACRIAQYSGGTWSEVDGGLNANPTSYGMTMSPDNKVYVVGAFTQAGSITACRLAAFDPNTSAWMSVGSAIGTPDYGTINSVAFSDDGMLYVGGGFDTAGGSSNSVPANLVAWNGVSWIPVGSNGVGDADETVSQLFPSDDGRGILFVGGFTDYGIPDLPCHSEINGWNGTTFYIPYAVDLPGTALVSAYLTDASGNTTLGFSTTGTACVPGHTNITNSGTAKAYPVLSASGPGRLYHFNNDTIGKKIMFDYVLQSGETVELDLRTGKKTFTSDMYGDIIKHVLPDSNVATMALIPGTNSISIYISGCTTDASAELTWTPRYWSLDGSA